MDRRIRALIGVDMGLLKEGTVQLYPEEGGFLTYVQMSEFPWFFSRTTLNYVGMMHTLMHRYEDNLDANGYLKEGEKARRGIENSPHLPAAESLFLRICAENSITVRTVYRAAFNRTFHEPDAHSDVHIDHTFPHKVFILYIDARSGGDTLLCDKEGNVKETIKAEDGKFVIFDGDWHANSFCKPHSTRIVFVVTFDGDVNA